MRRTLPLMLIFLCQICYGQGYLWLENHDTLQNLYARIPTPTYFERIPLAEEGFESWLRKFPLKPAQSEVFLFDGRKKMNQRAHVAVLNIDVGEKDLQQCADAIIRLKAEYQFASHRPEDISFNFTSGDPAKWEDWALGMRPIIQGNEVNWQKTRQADHSYRNFRSYLNTVFIYAGSYSLSRELDKVSKPDSLRPGHVFIQGGFPGHAVIVMDVAVHQKTGKPIFLLAQSYMPAQEIHILKNPHAPDLSPWFELPEGPLLTPEWIFPAHSLKKFH